MGDLKINRFWHFLADLPPRAGKCHSGPDSRKLPHRFVALRDQPCPSQFGPYVHAAPSGRQALPGMRFHHYCKVRCSGFRRPFRLCRLAYAPADLLPKSGIGALICDAISPRRRLPVIMHLCQFALPRDNAHFRPRGTLGLDTRSGATFY